MPWVLFVLAGKHGRTFTIISAMKVRASTKLVIIMKHDIFFASMNIKLIDSSILIFFIINIFMCFILS